MSAIDSISINKAFWFRVQKYMISFRFEGMPEDVHFSIAYNENSPDINLHITRNTSDSANKPKIEIARIAKKDAADSLPYLVADILNLILQPIYLRSFGRRGRHSHYGIFFHSFAEIENNEVNQWIKKKLVNRVTPLTRIKKSCLKIKGDIEASIKPIAGDAAFTNILEKNFHWLPHKPFAEPQAGFIISRKFKGCVICINSKWYSYRQDIKPLDLLCACMEPALAKRLIFKTLMAYARIKELYTRSASEKHSHPLCLYKILPR